MSDKRVRSIDPLGIIALAHVLVRYGPGICPAECSCENIPVCPCEGDDGCSCENIPVCPCEGDDGCSCENIPVCPCEDDDKSLILDMLSNPVFREVVQKFDVRKVKTIEGFLSIVNEIQQELDAAARQK